MISICDKSKFLSNIFFLWNFIFLNVIQTFAKNSFTEFFSIKNDNSPFIKNSIAFILKIHITQINYKKVW